MVWIGWACVYRTARGLLCNGGHFGVWSQELETHNKADLLLFSNRQNVYKMKIYEIEDCKASSLGEFLSNVLSLEEGEEIIHMVATDDYKGYMIFGFENGRWQR